MFENGCGVVLALVLVVVVVLIILGAILAGDPTAGLNGDTIECLVEQGQATVSCFH